MAKCNGVASVETLTEFTYSTSFPCFLDTSMSQSRSKATTSSVPILTRIMKCVHSQGTCFSYTCPFVSNQKTREVFRITPLNVGMFDQHCFLWNLHQHHFSAPVQLFVRCHFVAVHMDSALVSVIIGSAFDRDRCAFIACILSKVCRRTANE